MKRLVRFILLTLGYLVAIARVATRRISRPRKNSKLSRRRLGMISGSALALLGLVVAGNLLSPPANAVTIRSGSGTDSCTVDVGNASYASVTKNGDYCVVTVTTSTSVTFPSYVNTIGIVVVGGGGGGGTDGGAGGSGGETRYSAAQGVTAAGTVTVTVGAGGAGAVWSGGGGANGSPTSVSGAGLSYTANGGYVGGGWNSCSIRYGLAGGSGGTGGTSATGGTGGNGTLNGCPSSGGFSSGGAGGNGPYISTISGINASYFAGGGGGGTCLGVGTTYSVTGAAGGAAGGGRGTDYTANVGATAGFAGTPNTGGGGGAGAACDWSNADYNGSTERTPGGAGGSGVAVMSWQENRTSVSQAPDGCLYNVAEACLQSAKIQLTNAQGSNLATAGVTVSLVSTSTGTVAGTLSATTDSNGLATLGGFWLTGTAIGSTPTLTFEAVGYRNVQTTITMKGYAETLNIVSGSTDTAGSFFGTSGEWLATATTSNLSVTTLQNQLTARNVALRASAASSAFTGDIIWAGGGTVNESAASSRTMTFRATRNIQVTGDSRLTSSGQPLNVIFHSDYDGLNGGSFHLDGSATAYSIETNGGAVAVGGGTGTTTWNSLAIPASFAAGYALYTGSWWGVELGVNTDLVNSKLISTAGGKVRINGYAWQSPGVSKLYGIAYESGKIDVGAGDIELIGGTNGSPSVATNDNWGVGIGANHATANDRPVMVTSGTISASGTYTTAGTSNYYGVAIGYSDITSGSGGLNVTSTQRTIIWEGCTFGGPVNLAGSATFITGINTFAGSVTATATAGDTWFSGAQTLSTNGSTLMLKATGNVLLDPNTALQTNAGNVTLWSDTDGTTSRGGGVKTGVGSSIVSNGGAISLSGGTDNTSSWAKGTSTTGDAGVWISGAINSGAGNINIRGEEAATTTGANSRAGVFIDKAASITATGAGTITIDGKVDATNSNTADYHYGVWLGNADAAALATVTAGSGAISIKGDATANAGQYRRGILMNKATVSSDSGAITFDGQAGTATNCLDFYFYLADNTVSSNTGAVLLKGKAGSASVLETGTISSGTSVTLQLSKLSVTSAKTLTLGGASPKVIESTSTENSFGAAVDLTGVAMSANTTSVRVGKTTNGAAVTLGTAWATAGPISVYGGTAAVNANMTITGSGNAFLVKTMGDITTGNSVTVQTNSGNIVFWPNSDKVAAVANNTGRFASGTNLTLRSQGGKIWIAGGLDDGGGDGTITAAKGAWSSIASADGLPDGYAVGINTSGNTMGVYLGAGYTLSSAGGDIFLAGMDAPTSDTAASYTMQFVSGLIDSGTGRIGIWSKAYANATSNGGLILHTTDNSAGSIITSANRTAQAITIYGDTSANTNTASDGITSWGYAPGAGQFGYQSLQLIASGLKDSSDLANFPGGGITVTGIASGSGSGGGAHGIVWQWADALAKDGPINFSGQNTEGAGGYSGAGMYIGADNYSIQSHFGAWHAALTYTNLAGAATDFSTSTSNVTLNANKYVFYQPTNGVGATARYYFTTSGDITLQSVGSTFTSPQDTTHWQFYYAVFAGSPRNVTIGKSTDVSKYNWYNDISATGSIKLYGKDVWVMANTDLITTLAASGTSTRNTGVLIKSTDRTYFQGTNVVQSGGSDLTLWLDYDGDGIGATYAEAGLQLKSNGGNITIAGGADDGAANNTEITGRTASDGSPDNYSGGYSGWGASAGIDITGGSYQLLSSGGDIFLAGRGSATAGDDDYGVLLRGGLMYSNAGKIAIYGKAPASCLNNWHRGIGLGWNGDGGVADSIVSNSTAADAIKLYGDMSSCNNGVNVASMAIQDFYSAGTNIAAPNGGGITLSGKQGNASASGGSWANGDNQESSILELNYTNILANSGSIDLTGARVSGTGNHSVRFNTRGTGQANSVGARPTTISTGFTAYPTINIASSTSDVTVTGDSQVLYQATFRNTGDLVLQPYAANFDRTQYFSSGWAASFPTTYKNVRIGKAGTNGSNQNNADLFLDRFAATGDIAIYGGNIGANNGFTTTETSGNGILLKATNTITFSGGSSGANITTQVTGTNSTAPINIWANADATGEGFIYINNYNDFTTQGGAINFGGSAAASDTSPSSYAVSNTSSRGGVTIGNTNGTSNANVRIASNGGNIAIRGKGTNTSSWGIVGYAGFNINSGTGRIVMDGYQTNTGNGIDLEGTSSNLGTITSAAISDATPAISITGKCDNSGTGDAGQRGLYLTLGITVSATGGGDVSLTGDNVAIHGTNPGSVYMFGLDVLASTGTVKIDGGTDGVVTSTSGNTSNIGAVSAGTATGAVSIIGDRITSAGATNVKTSGAVVAESKSANFTTFSLAGTSVNAAAESIRLGKTTDTASAMTVGGSLAANGTISIYGGNIALSAGLSVTPSTTGAILVKGGGDITTSGSRTFSTQGGNATFWSDSDANGSGRIGFDTASSITTLGGKITIAGGADDGASTVATGRTASDGLPDGFAAGNGNTSACTSVSGTLEGVFFGTTATLNSSGGDIFIAGKGLAGATGSCAAGIVSNQDLWVKAGAGKIAMYGAANAAAASTYSSGIIFYGNTSRKTIISSSNAAIDAIVLSGNAGSTASKLSSGIFFHGQTAGANVNNIIANTGTGGVQVSGRSVPTVVELLNDNVGDALEMYGLGVLAKSGPIVLTGVTGASSASNRYGCSMDHSSASSLSPSQVSIGARAATTIDGVDMSSSSSNVTLNCDSFLIGSATQAKSVLTTGTVSLKPADGAQSFDRAIDTSGLTLGSGVSGFTLGQSGTGGTVSGGTQNDVDLTLSSAISIAGPISVYGTSIFDNADLTTTSGAITLKATMHVAVGAGTSAAALRTIQTAGGEITLWPNADATGSGAITMGNYSKLASAGGAITLAGGSSASETSPTGKAKSSGTTTFGSGIELGTIGQASNITLISGGGDITLRGYSNSNTTDKLGIKMWQGATVDSGTGAIIIDAATDSCSGTTNCHAFEIFGNNLAPTTIQSAKTSGTAISIAGATTGTSSDSVAVSLWYGSVTNFHKIQATGGGGISITGTSPSTTAYSVRLNSAYLFAKGNITVDTGTQGLSVGGQSSGAFATVGGSSAAADDAGDITIKSGTVAFGPGIATFRNTGKFVLEPTASSFTAAQTIPATYFIQTGQSAIRLGKTGNNANLTVSSALTAAGNLELYGGAISASANLSTTNSGDITVVGSGAYTGSASLNASGSIAVTAASFAGTGALTSAGGSGISVVATAGDVNTGANMTANTVGTAPITLKATANILLNNNLTSAGGPITLGSDSDDLSAGGILTAAGTLITSNGGAVTLAGGVDPTVGFAKATTSIYSTANAAYSGIRLIGGIVAGAGDVTLRGKDNATAGISSHNSGIEAEKTASIKTTTGAISLDGQLSNGVTGAGNHIGVLLGWGGTANTGTNIYSTTTGNITIKGSASTLNSAVGFGLWLSPTTISSTDGSITLEGNGSSMSAYDFWLTGADISSSTGAVLVKTGTTGGKALFDTSTSKLSSGTSVTLDVKTPTFTLLELAGVGTKTIEPPVGASAFGGAVSTANITIASSSTALTIGSSTNTSAVSLGKSTSIAGPIAVYGGDVTNSANLTATGSTGSIAINSNGLFTNSAAISSAGGNQPTTIKADKAALTGSITSGTGITTITGFTAAKTIDLGLSGDTTSSLALTNTELGTITAGAIRVGDSTSGTITVSANITIATAKSNNLALRTAGNVTATNGSIITATNLGISAGGTISLGGNNGITGNLAIVAGGASAGSGVSFGSAGNYTAAAVDGITPDYGIGKNISVASAPAIGSTEVRYLNQTWSAPPVLTVKDEYGYVISTNNLNKSTYITTVAGSGSPTIAGSTPVLTGGTQTFSSLNFTTTAGTTELTFATAGLASGGTATVTTGTYDVQGGEPQSIAISYTSTSAPARKIGFGLTATLKDAGGNTVSGPHAADTITVAVSDGDADATNNATIISGNTPATTAGVANFASLILGGKVGVNYTLTFSVTYLDSASVSRTKTATQVVTLTPGDAAKLAVTTQAVGFVNRTNFTTQPVVTIQDADGNTVTTASDTVSVAVTAASGPSTQGLTGTTSVAAVSGVATFAGLGKTGLIGDKTLTFSAGSLTSATQAFTLTFGAANKLAMTSPATTVNDAVFGSQPIVTIQDQDGNTVGDSTTQVTLTSSNATIGGTLIGSDIAMNAVGGVANFSGKNVKLTGLVGARSLSATSTSLTGVTNTVTITYGAANKLAITRQAAGAVNGVNFTTQPQVTVQDVSGNTVSNSAAAISVASSGAVLAGTSPVNSISGVATFAGLNLTGTATTYTLTFTSGSLTSDQQSITLTYGAAHHLALTTAAAGAVNGVAFTTQPVVTIQDQSNNTVANLNSTVTVASSGSVLSSNNSVLTVSAANGVATFANALKLTGVASTYTLTYSISAPAALTTTQSITVTPGAATQLAVTTQAAGFVNRTDFTTAPAVSIQDANGNLVTTATDSITVSISSGNLTGTTTVAAVNGVATFTGLGKNGTIGSKTLTFHTGLLTDATQTFTLTYGAAYQLSKTSPAAGFVNNTAFTTQPKITIQDQDGNTVADSTATVTVTSSGATLGGNAAMAAVAGVADFAGKGIKLTGTVGDYSLTYAMAGPITATQSVTLTYGAADHLTLTTEAAGSVNRVAFTTQPVVEVRDVSNNVVANSTLQISAASSAGATIGGTASRTAVAGVANFDLGTTKTQLYGTVGSYTITYSASSVTAASQSLTLTFGVATKLAMTSPVTTVNDTVFATQPIVTIQDQDGNTITNSTAPIALTSSDATLGGNLQGGAVAMNAVAGVANFAGKNVKLTGTIGARNLTAEASGLTSVTNQVTITFGAATNLALTTEPAGFVNRANFTTQPVVTVQDVSGNTVANSSISVDVEIDSGALTGTTRINAVNGVATFAGLGKLGTIGDKTLTFKDTAGLLNPANKQFTLTHGTAHHTSLAVASTLANDTEFATQPVVTIYDQDNNVVTSGSQSSQAVTLAVTGATAVALGGTASMNAVAGVADFDGKGVKLTGLVGAKTLTATISSPSAIVRNETVTITYGVATKLAIDTAAAGASNGAQFGAQPVILVQDVSGNTVANSTAQVVASVNAGTLGGINTISAVSGVATFTDLALTATAGNKTLTYASSLLTSATQTILAVTGAPTQLRIDVAGSLVNNTAFATQPVVTLLDATGIMVSAGSYAAQTVTLSSPDSTIAGTVSMTSVAGVADFTGKGVKLTGLVGARSLVATISRPTSVTASASVTITYGAAHHLNISSGASGATSRVAFTSQPAIEILDISGNRVDNSTVTVSVASSAGNGATLGGDASMSAASGIAYFNQNANKLKLSGAVGSYNLTYSSASLGSASETIVLTHGVATQIVLTQNAAGAKSGQAFTTQPRVEVRDADGNLVDTGVAATAQIKVATGATAYDADAHLGADLTGPANSDVVTALAGVATFSNLRLEGVAAAAYALNFETVNTTGYNGISTTQNIALTAGAQTQLRVVDQPTNIVAGVAFATAVKAEILDAWKNRVLDVASTATIKPTLVSDALASTAIDSTKTAVANSAGLATFTGLTFTKAGTHYVQFTSAGLTAVTSSSFVITNAAAHHLTWVTQPVGAKNDYAIKGAAGADPELEVRDQYQNPILVGVATTVDVTEEPSTADVQGIRGGTVISDSNARVKFNNLVLRAKVGSYTLRFTATNGALPINGTYVDSADPVAITFGYPTALRLTRIAAGATSGAPFATQPKLNIEDSAGNIVSDSTLAVSVTETETQVLSGIRTIAATAGQVDFTGSGMMLSGSVASGLNLKYAINYNGNEISTSQTINLDPGLAVALTIGQQPTTVKTRVAFNPVPTVVLRDAAGNQVTSDNASTVTALLKDAGGNPVAAETGAFTSSGGLITFTGLSFQAPSTENYYVTFKLVSNGQTVTSSAFDILPGNATELRVTTAPSTLNQDQTMTMTGELLAQQPVVKLYDQDGNLVTTTTSGSATIRVKSGAGGALTSGQTTATYTGGIATFTGVKLVGTPGVDYVLEFTNASPSLTSTASSAMRVVHNVADHIAITTAAAGGKAGTRFSTQPVITVLDRFENVVTDGPGSDALVTADAAITSQGNTALGAPLAISPSNAEVAAVNGVATFDSLTISGLVSNTYALTYSLDLAGIASRTQPNITITYGSFNHLTIRTQPVGGNATGEALSTQPVVELRDGSENIVADPSVHSTLTASISSTDGLVLLDNTLANPSAARLENATAVSSSGVVTFSQLKLLGLPGTSYTLKFAINTRFTTSSPVYVTHAVAHHLTVTQQPTGGNATGANLAGQPVVELRDRFENVVTSNSTDVVAARIATATGVSLTGNTTATLAAGVATFAGLKVIALPDNDYTLDFTTTVGANSMTSAATNSFRVTYSTPAKLAMIQQPVGGTTGTALTTQPIVEVQDVYGNRVFNYSGSITAAVGGSGSTLTSASASDLSVVVSNGRATFTDLALTATPATDYQLSFSAGSLVGVNSANLQVVPGAPVRIEILNQPIGAQTGAALAGQPVVRVVDTFGNLVTQDNATVITADLTSGAGGTLSRVVSSQSVAITATVTGGVATFSNLYMRGLTNHNYQLTFTSGSLGSAVSTNFTVSHAAVASLVWNTQPTVGMTGSPLTRAAVLELQDMDGNIATSDSTTVVTAAITTGVGGSLTQTTATANQGVVTFTNLVLTGTPGVTYKLTFTGAIGGSSVTALESDGLVPVHAVPAKVTARGGNVVGALSDQNLASQPSLYVRDRFNNIATSDNSTVVTASILDDVTGSVSGNVTATAVNGVVTFSGLKVAGTPGTDYALRYTADWSGTTLTSATSNLFHVSKVADVTLSYATQAYSPNAVVHAAFYADSPGGMTYTSSASSLVCELDPGTGDLTIKGAGNCLVRVDVDVDQDGFYLANYAEATLVITKATQAAVSITSPAAVDYWSGLTPVASGGSGTGAISLSVVDGSTCRLIGATILPGDAGSLCQINATRAGDTNYLPQTSAVQTIEVRKINQAALAIASANSMTVDSLSLFTSGGSGTGAVSYSLVSAGTAHCSISGAVLSATASGACSIRATKAASINYNVITSGTQSITVRKDSQTVAFTSTAPMNPIVLGSYAPTAAATSGLAVNFTVANGSTCSVDNVDPGKITFTSVGLCEIIATQSGSNRFASASVRQFVQVGALNQTINFDVIPDLAYGTPAFKLAPTTNAGTRAVITLATTSNSNACSLADDIVTLSQAGVCEIVATQGGYGSYAAASDVVRTFKVLADQAGAPHIFSSSVATHSITASFTPPSYTGGSAITGFVLVATDTSGNSFENAACPTAGATITCTIVGIPNDVAYTAVARAITTAGRGAESNVSMSQTPIDAPMAVTNLTATTSANNLVVTWTPPIVAAGAGVTGYDVYVAPIGEALPATTPYRVNGASASSTTITNLLNQSTTPSASPTPAPTATISPARISFRRASVSSPSPSASNSAPSNSVSVPAGYQVRIVTLVGSSIIASDTNTTNGFQTNFSVPLSPSQLTLTVTGNDLMTSWSAPTADGGSQVVGYDVKVNGSVICAATTSLFCEFTGMQPGRTYSVEVLAINAVGFSSASASSHSVAALPVVPVAGGGGWADPNAMAILGASSKTALSNGGQLLTLNTRNFAGVISALLDGKPVKIVSNTEDHITLELPTHEPGTVDITFKSKIGTLVFQDAVTFIAPPRADAQQTFSRYRTNFVATNAKMISSIRAVVLAKEAPKAMVCVGLVPVKYTANDVRLAKIRAANVCAVGAQLDGNLAVRATTGITKLTGPAARAVKVTYKY